MRVHTRSDWCIALRIIALHEYYRLQTELARAMLAELLSDPTIRDDELQFIVDDELREPYGEAEKDEEKPA